LQCTDRAVLSDAIASAEIAKLGKTPQNAEMK